MAASPGLAAAGAGGAPDHSTADPAATGEVEEPERNGEETGFVRGVVSTSEGEPVAGAHVRYLGPALRGLDPPEAVTDREGVFSLGGLPLPPIQLRLAASKEGQASHPATCVAREEPGSAPWVRLVLEPGGAVSVTVVDTAGSPVASAKVFLKNEAGKQVQGHVLTDANGQGWFANVPPGMMTVSAEALGYSQAGYGAGAAAERSVRVAAGEFSEATLTLEATGAAHGVVYDASGRAVGGAGVYMRMLTASGFRKTTYTVPVAVTDGEGRFRIGELASGRVQLCAVAPGRGLSPWVELPAQGRAAQGDAVLELFRPHSVAGSVVDASGRPQPGAKVTYRPNHPDYGSVQAWSVPLLADDGRFRFGGIPALDSVFEATVGGGKRGKQAVTAADVASGVHVRIVVLEEDVPTLAGYVLGPDGRAIAHPAVRLHDQGGVPKGIADVGADGFFSLPLRSYPPWTVSASAALLAPRFAVVGRAEAGDAFSFELSGGATLAVDVVTDIPEEWIPPDTNVAVSMRLRELPSAPFVVEWVGALRAQTVALFEHLCPGRYICEVRCESLFSNGFGVVVNSRPGVVQRLRQPVLVTLGAVVEGRVVGADGVPMPEAYVRPVGSPLPQTRTVGNGAFKLIGVPPGDVSIRAETAEHYGLSPEVHLARGAEVRVADIRLDRPRADRPPQTLHTVTIGIEWRHDNDGWAVARVLPGTSASAAGLQAGDRLTAVDRVSTRDWSPDVLRNALGGQAGTSVDLSFGRGGRNVTARLERQVLE